MDCMINHYTANKKVRNDDAYSPGGQIGLRPDRATLPYCQRAREAFPGVPIIAGGVEASLRRLAHYDYWSDTVRRSIMLDAKADLVVFGMGEHQIVEIARRLAAGETVKDLRDMRGVAYALGASESQSPPGDAIVLPVLSKRSRPTSSRSPRRPRSSTRRRTRSTPSGWCSTTTARRSSATRRRLPLSQDDMDRVYGLPYTRQPHPTYTGQQIPALRDDQGLGDDHARLLRRLHVLLDHRPPGADHPVAVAGIGPGRGAADGPDPEFTGMVSDIGGPTANMYQMRCTRPEVEAKCKRLSCVHPTICKLLGTDHGPLVDLMQREPRGPGHRQGLRRLAASAWTWPSSRPNTWRSWPRITSAAT